MLTNCLRLQTLTLWQQCAVAALVVMLVLAGLIGFYVWPEYRQQQQLQQLISAEQQQLEQVRQQFAFYPSLAELQQQLHHLKQTTLIQTEPPITALLKLLPTQALYLQQLMDTSTAKQLSWQLVLYGNYRAWLAWIKQLANHGSLLQLEMITITKQQPGLIIQLTLSLNK